VPSEADLPVRRGSVQAGISNASSIASRACLTDSSSTSHYSTTLLSESSCHARFACLPAHLRTGTAWAAFARLEPHIHAVIQHTHGCLDTAWPEPIKSFFRELWRGTHDLDVTKASALLPGHFDQRAMELQKAR
jgi:hypothetical protein